MQHDFDFGLSDLAEQTERSIAARWVAVAVGVIFWLLSAVTTAAFFARFAPSGGALAGPDLAPAAAGVMGVALLDVGALAWAYLRARGATSGAQMTIALAAAVLDLLLSLATSGLYVALTSSFDVQLPVASLHAAGATVAVLALAANFGALFIWQVTSAGAVAAAGRTALAAQVAAGRQAVDAARARLVINQTMRAIAAQLPDLAAQAGRAEAGHYLSHTLPARPLPDQTAEPEPEPEPVPAAIRPSANGHGPERPTRGNGAGGGHSADTANFRGGGDK